MQRMVTMKDWVDARRKRLVEEAWAAGLEESRRLLRMGVGFGLFFAAWLGRGLGFW